MGVLEVLAATRYSAGAADLDDVMDMLSSSSSAQGVAIWGIISLVLAVVGGLVIYFLFVKSKKKPVNKFLAWMQSFLRFDKMMIEDIVKVTYLVLALALTLSSFGLIGTDFLTFVLTLVLGNVILRVGYELTMIVIAIWSNTTKIRDSLAGGKVVAEKKAKEVKEAKETVAKKK